MIIQIADVMVPCAMNGYNSYVRASRYHNPNEWKKRTETHAFLKREVCELWREHSIMRRRTFVLTFQSTVLASLMIVNFNTINI